MKLLSCVLGPECTSLRASTSDEMNAVAAQSTSESTCTCKYGSFLPRCLQCRSGLAMRILSVRLPVSLSVTRVDCDKTVTEFDRFSGRLYHSGCR